MLQWLPIVSGIASYFDKPKTASGQQAAPQPPPLIPYLDPTLRPSNAPQRDYVADLYRQSVQPSTQATLTSGYLPQRNADQPWGARAAPLQAAQWDQYYNYTKGSPIHNIGMKAGHWLATGRW